MTHLNIKIHLNFYAMRIYVNRKMKEKGKLKIQIKMNFVIPFKILILCLISNPSNLGLHKFFFQSVFQKFYTKFVCLDKSIMIKAFAFYLLNLIIFYPKGNKVYSYDFNTFVIFLRYHIYNEIPKSFFHFMCKQYIYNFIF